MVLCKGKPTNKMEATWADEPARSDPMIFPDDHPASAVDTGIPVLRDAEDEMSVRNLFRGLLGLVFTFLIKAISTMPIFIFGFKLLTFRSISFIMKTLLCH